MDFGFRAGDGRRPPHLPSEPASHSYFTAQALRAGIVMRPHLEPVVDPPLTAREALHRELHKERLHEEVLAEEASRSALSRQFISQLQEATDRDREAAQSRSLLEEEEVRRERERVLTGRGQEVARLAFPRLAPMYPELVSERFPPYTPEAQLDRFPPRFTLRSGVAVGHFERASLPLRGPAHHPEVGFAGRTPLPPGEIPVIREEPFVPHPRPAKRVNLPVGRREPREKEAITLTESRYQKNTSGSKRKAADTSVASADRHPQPAKDSWTCILCQISTTSEQGLREHYQGKKHKAKKEGLDIEAPNKKAKETLEKPPLEKGGPSEPTTTSEEKQPILCALCNVKCFKPSVFESHLKGKKHIARVEESTKAGIEGAKKGKKPMKRGDRSSGKKTGL